MQHGVGASYRIRRFIMCITALSVVIGTVATGKAAHAVDAVSISASAPNMAPGSTIDLTAGMPVIGSGTVAQEIVQQLDPAKVKLTGASDITYPNGWTLSYCSGASTDCSVAANFSATPPANAAAWAQVKAVKASGSVVTDDVPDGGGLQVARSDVSGAGVAQTPASLQVPAGKDGFNPFFDYTHDRIYNIYHHESAGQLDCWVRLTGQRCAGFPFLYGGSSEDLVMARSVGTKIWIQGTNGLRCVDISHVLENTGNTSGGGSPASCSTPLVSLRSGAFFGTFTGGSTNGSTGETTLWTLDTQAAKVTAYCVDTETLAPCTTIAGVRVPSIVTTITGNNFGDSRDATFSARASIVRWGDRLYIKARGTAATTFDYVCYTEAGTACPGWTNSWYSTDYGAGGKFFTLPNASGTTIAVCLMPDSWTTTFTVPCWDANGTRSNNATLSTYLRPTNPAGISGYGVPSTDGSRVLIGNGGWSSDPEVMCFDASLNGGAGGRCTGAGSNWTQANYTAVPDPEITDCIWIGGHSVALKSYDLKNRVDGCSALAPTKAIFSGTASVPRMGCSSSNAIGGWRSFLMTAPTSGFTSAKLTIKNSSGLAIPGWSSVPIAANVVQDLSSLTVTSTGQTPSFEVELVGASGAVTVQAKITAVGSAPQLCTEVTAIAVCPSPPGPVDAPDLAGATFTARADGSSGGSTLSSATSSVAVSAPTVADCSGTLSGRAVDAGVSQQAIPGAVVTLRDSSGAVLTYPSDWSDVTKRGLPISTTTDSSGNYSFTGLTATDYKVSFANTSAALVSTSTVTSGGSGTTNASGGQVTSTASSITVGGTGVINAVYNLVATASADTSTGGQGVTQTISPMTNDTASTGASKPATGTPVKLCQPGTSAPCSLTSVVVSGEGTYTANSNGTVTFAPEPGFTGVATPVPYTYTDSASSAASSTITATVVPVPVPAANTGSGDWDTNQVFSPFADDTPGSVGGTSYPFTASSVKICTPVTADGSCTSNADVVVAGQGTWSVNPTSGAVTFNPLPSFTGTATALKYCVSDSVNQKVCSTITPTVNAPVAPSASAESKSVAPGGTVAFSTLTGTAGAGGASAGQSLGGLATRATSASPQFVNTSTCLITPGSNPAVCDADGVVTVAGEGVYTLNTTTGVVSFVTDANAPVGSLTPITYKVTDQVGNTATSTLTPVVPAPPLAVNDTSSGSWDSNQTISVLANDTVSATPPVVKLCSTAELAATPVNCTQSSVTTADGTYTVNGDGSITFDPLATFTGVSTQAPTYQVADAAGQKARATITPTVAAPPAPSANPDTQVVAPVSTGGTGTVTFDPLLGAGGLATGAGNPTVCLIDPSAGLCAGGNSVTIAGAGTYVLDPTTKIVTFTLASGVSSSGSLPAATYQVTDSFGQTATATLTPVIPVPPTANPDTSSGYQDVNQIIPVLGNDSVSGSGNALVPGSVKICATGSTPCSGTTLTNSDGVYTANADGTVTFDPASTFTGTATPIAYTVSDATGQKASSTITATVVAIPAGAALPTARSDTKTGPYGQAMTFTPIAGTTGGAQSDSAGTAPAGSSSGGVTTSYSTLTIPVSSVKLCASGQVLPNCSATSLSTADGTYTVNGDGTVTFSPATGFTGTATQPVTYQVSNSYTKTVVTVETALVDPTTTCVLPTCTFVTADDADGTASNGTGGDGVYTPTWTTTTTIQTDYSYSATALLTPTVGAPSGPSASNDSASTTSGTPVTVTPHSNDTAGSYQLRPSSILLCDSGETAPACTKTTVTIAGQGTFSVDTGTGAVTFTPESGFTGTASVPYRILDWNGSATNAMITVTVTAPAGTSAGGSGGSSATNDPAAEASPPPNADSGAASTTADTAPCTRIRCSGATASATGDASGPRLRPQRGSTVVNTDQPVILDPWIRATPTPGHQFIPSSLRLWDGTAWVREHTEPGVGTWSIRAGRITFIPARGFTGEAVIRVRAADTSHARAISRMKVIVVPVDQPARQPHGDVPSGIHAGAAFTSRRCPSARVGGEPIAWVNVDGISVPIKRVSYPVGGVLAPPPSAKVAGLSSRHAPLDATTGTSVLTWHVRFGEGCDGDLNTILDKPIGSTFSVRTKTGAISTYRISQRDKVPQGNYRASWFDQGGPHRLALFTCSDLVAGKFRSTIRILAIPASSTS